MGAPASLYGLELTPCDPLVLGVRLDGKPLHGLTAAVDWRIGGRISDLVRDGLVPEHGPLLFPVLPVIPAQRLLIWRVDDVSLEQLAGHLEALGAPHPGLCPADLGLDAAEVRQALGPDAVLFSAEPDPAS